MKDRATVHKKTVPPQTSQIYFLEKPAGFSILDLKDLSQDKREAIRLLHRRDDKHNMRILVFFAIWAVAGVAALTVDLLAVQVLSCLAIACAIIGCTVLVHEASHNLLFLNPTANRWLGLLCGLPVLVSVTGFRTNHAFHHARRGSYDESAEWKVHPRGDVTSLPKYLLSIIAGAYGFITVLPVIAIKYAQGATRRKTLTEYALIVGAFALVFSAFPTEAILKLWLFPIILAAHLTEFRAVAEHGLTTRGNVFTATRTVVSNRVVSFLMCNINYHLEHHLFPGVPWYNLPKVHRLLQDEYRQAGSSVYPSYTRFCIDFFKAIWRGLLPNARLIPVEARQH